MMELSKQHYELYEMSRDCEDILLSTQCALLNGHDPEPYRAKTPAMINALREYLTTHSNDEIMQVIDNEP